MSHIHASSQTWVLDGAAVASASPPFPSASIGIPDSYYIVIDDIGCAITSSAVAGDVTVTIKADDGTVIFVIGKSFGASDTDSFHLNFPKGLTLPKLMRNLGGGGKGNVTKLGAYTNAGMFVVAGAPTVCSITVNFRYVPPAAVGW